MTGVKIGHGGRPSDGRLGGARRFRVRVDPPLRYSVFALVGGGAASGAIQIVWMLTSSRMPKPASSRP